MEGATQTPRQTESPSGPVRVVNRTSPSHSNTDVSGRSGPGCAGVGPAIVRTALIDEILVGKQGDYAIRLRTGQTYPLARRRRDDVEARLRGE